MAIEPEQAGPLRVVVVGAGAVGSFLGGSLASPAATVTLLARRPYEGPDADTLLIEDVGGARHVHVRRTGTWRAPATSSISSVSASGPM